VKVARATTHFIQAMIEIESLRNEIDQPYLVTIWPENEIYERNVVTIAPRREKSTRATLIPVPLWIELRQSKIGRIQQWNVPLPPTTE
jgi:hypothetical protein